MDNEPLSEEELRELDAAYAPFPPFEEWAKHRTNDARWQRYTTLLHERRTSLTPEQSQDAIEFVTRAAALDTGSLEGLYSTDRGFTITVARKAARWEEQIEKRGPLTRGLFEAHLSIYELVFDAATEAHPLSEAFIRRLHEVACAPQATYTAFDPSGKPFQRELIKGKYKDEPNHVRKSDGEFHAYAPVAETGPEMHRLVTELNSPAFQSAHPVLQSAFAHYAFVVIHPFPDGNGRVARALASTYTFRALSLPLLILIDDRDTYLGALEQADQGNYQVFVDFVAARCQDSIVLMLDSLELEPAAPPESAVADLASLLTVRGELARQDYENIAMGLLNYSVTEFNNQAAALGLPAGVHASVSQEGGVPSPEVEGYRQPVPAAYCMRLRLTADAPANAGVEEFLHAMVAVSDDELFSYCVVANDPVHQLPMRKLEVRLDEVWPSTSGVFMLRLQQWTRAGLAEMLGFVAAQTRENLTSGGFIQDLS